MWQQAMYDYKIGELFIDLEDRYFGDPDMKQYFAYDIWMEKLKKRKKKLEMLKISQVI